MSHISTDLNLHLDLNNMSYEETAYYIYGIDIDIQNNESNIS